MKKILILLFIAAVATEAFGGTVTGQILTATGGAIANGTLSLQLNQYAVVAGTAAIAPATVNCYTDNLGNITGLPTPLVAPVLSVNLGAGSLGAGTYFVVYAWSNSTGTTFYSPESSILLTGAGTLIVAVPASPPAGATNWKIFIGTTSLGETQQISQASPFSNYSQSSSIVAGAALPGSNTSTCSLRFNDELVPSFTKYNVSLKTQSGATVSGFPMFWQLFGGNAGTINVSNGFPLASNAVVYPFPVVTNPNAQSQQSINGPLTLNGFGLTAGTGTAITGASTLTLANAGNFANNAITQYMVSNIGALNFATEEGIFNGASNQIAAISAGLSVPGSANSSLFSSAIEAWANSSSTTVPLFGINSQVRCLVSGYRGCWAADFAFKDAPSLAVAGPLTGIEMDCDPQNPAANYTGGAVDCIQAILNANITGQTFSSAFHVISGNSSNWLFGLRINDGASVNALSAGATCSSGSCGSAPIQMRGFASSVLNTVSMSNDGTGNLLFSSSGGANDIIKWQFGTNTNSVSFVVANPGANQTVNVPDFGGARNDTLVGLAATQTLTNKTVQAADGTAGAPTLSFINNTNSGLWHPGTSNVGFSANGTNILNFNAGSVTFKNAVPLQWASGDPFATGATSGISQIASDVVTVGNGTQGDASALVLYNGNKTVLTADWTCGTGGTQTACTAAAIIGSGGGVPMTFTLPLVANSYQLDCDFVISQATAATALQFALLTATNGATNVTAQWTGFTAATTPASGVQTDTASTTTTFNIGTTFTLGAINSKMPFHIHAAIEGASASGTVLSAQIFSTSNVDLVTIYRGGGCHIY